MILVVTTGDHGINLPRGTAVGYITPITLIDTLQTSPTTTGPGTHEQSKVELWQALTGDLHNSTFSKQQQQEALQIFVSIEELSP